MYSLGLDFAKDQLDIPPVIRDVISPLLPYETGQDLVVSSRETQRFYDFYDYT